MSDFRPCSARRPHSQASFYHCARQAISIRLEETLVRLRYSLGGDRPSQTARLPMSFGQFMAAKLESQFQKGGISPLSPPRPKPGDHRLPPILRNQNRNSMTRYSKAPRGLFV